MDLTHILPSIAEALSQKAREGRLSTADIQELCPWLCRQLVHDAELKGLLDLWGDCINVDENAGITIVEPGVLSVIGSLAHMPMNGSIVHAGLQHTYGYLLSTIVTPYGYKRDRWLSTRLEQGFGLPLDVLSPNPSHGTLLANATLFAGSIALRGDEVAEENLRQIAPFAAGEIRQIDFAGLEQVRVVESLVLVDSLGSSRSIAIRTDLVPFPFPVENCAETYLLVYSVKESDQRTARLTTLFPVARTLVEELTSQERLGPAVQIRARFNAYVNGLAGETVVGRRTLHRFRRVDKSW